jgi:hypothetical protein
VFSDKLKCLYHPRKILFYFAFCFCLILARLFVKNVSRNTNDVRIRLGRN